MCSRWAWVLIMTGEGSLPQASGAIEMCTSAIPHRLPYSTVVHGGCNCASSLTGELPNVWGREETLKRWSVHMCVEPGAA
jgi:hypothetical protein